VLPSRFIKGLDKARLRNFLVLFFVALAVPTAALIWQTYGQLKWEAFHQYRGEAEELARRIDTRLDDMIRTADARSFADYTFLVVTGDPSANFVQRSPLSTFPVDQQLPGILGYFQVDSDGVYSTPLLPPDGTPATSLGISDEEYRERLALARDIQAILADNRLVQSRPDAGAFRSRASIIAATREGSGVSLAASAGVKDVPGDDKNQPVMEAVASKEDYGQKMFDQLSELGDEQRAYAELAGAIELDRDLQDKVEAEEQEVGARTRIDDSRFNAPARSKRREQIALPESVASDPSEPIANIGGAAGLRISTFESEVDPFEFSVLDSGHFVLFRKVWRDDKRYIQGLLLDQASFIDDVIGQRFRDTALSQMSNLAIAYEGGLLRSFSGRDSLGYPDVAEGLDGTLLYRSRLTAPLENLELVFSIQRLPPGPGGSVLAWVTLVFAVVFVGGFITLYRLGLSQIGLARQQQDFVSAVGHELKTPITSIRMYGEMLKQGWTDEDKRQRYYEFIHDESERLSRLISNVLQLARITRNEPQFDLQPTRVGDLMSMTESRIASQIERASFECRFRRDEAADKATIVVDDDCFVQIVINLVDNAIKFSKDADQKRIEIGSGLTSADEILFSVRDYGPGIPKDQMKKIFELFYRSESELTRETVGTGIGLAIVHQLVIAMNGKVDIVNKEPGAEFRIWLPIDDASSSLTSHRK
jgi:signal transduction histidine kinase